MATINDVARAAGVSKSTVSIVLNGQSGDRRIPLATQQKVLQAMREVNYQPNLYAHNLRSSEPERYTIALYWATDSRTIVLARILKSIQRELANSDYKINLVVTPFTSGRIEDEKDLFGISAYNAAIIGTVDEHDLEYLENNAPMIPIVLFNRYSDMYNSVTVDNEEAGRIAAMQFINKGITDIGALLQDRPFTAMHKRRNSFIQICEKHGVTSLQKHTYITDGSIADGFKTAEKIAAAGHVPKAIYCDDDSLALGLLSAFAQAGIKIPGEVEVIAISTSPRALTEYSVPPLTVVELPLEKMINTCVELLVKQLRNQMDVVKHVQLPTSLEIRKTSLPK